MAKRKMPKKPVSQKRARVRARPHVTQPKKTRKRISATPKINWSLRRTPQGVNQIAQQYLPLVRIVAAKYIQSIGGDNTLQRNFNMERSDLVQSGFFGLRDAIRSFDPNRGIKFGTFAERRIRGAFMDEIRYRGSLIKKNRSAYAKDADQKTQKAESDFRRLQQEKAPSRKVRAALMRYDTLVRGRNANRTVSLNFTKDKRRRSGEDFDLVNLLSRKEKRTGTFEIRELILKRMGTLSNIEALCFMIRFMHPTPEQLRSLLATKPVYITPTKRFTNRRTETPLQLDYSKIQPKPYTHKQLGAIVGLTESRVSQIVFNAVRKILLHPDALAAFGIHTQPNKLTPKQRLQINAILLDLFAE